MDVMAAFSNLHRSTDAQRPCTKCGAMHSRPKNRSTKYLASYCLACNAAYNRATRKRYSDLSPIQRMKANCRSAAKMALRRGTLTKNPCWVCGAEKAEMHHEDYSKALEVSWLCKLCHVRYHIFRGDRGGPGAVEHSARHALDLPQILDAINKNRIDPRRVEHSGEGCTPQP